MKARLNWFSLFKDMNQYRNFCRSSGFEIIEVKACNNSNLHVVQAGNLGAVDGGRLPRLLVVAAPRANRVTGRAAGVAERRATGGVAQAPWMPP